MQPEHRARLVETIRNIARWRRQKGIEFETDKIARVRCFRAATAQRRLANFVEQLPDDDPDVRVLSSSPISDDGNEYRLGREALDLLSRFGMDRGAWQEGGPTEAQLRNALRRADGAETRARGQARKRAEAGYGEH